VASALVMNIEAPTHKRGHHLFRLKRGEPRRHLLLFYGIVTATRSVVISGTSPGIGSPVFRALSR